MGQTILSSLGVVDDNVLQPDALRGSEHFLRLVRDGDGGNIDTRNIEQERRDAHNEQWRDVNNANQQQNAMFAAISAPQINWMEEAVKNGWVPRQNPGRPTSNVPAQVSPMQPAPVPTQDLSKLGPDTPPEVRADIANQDTSGGEVTE